MIKEGCITDLAVLGEEFLQDADECKEAMKTLKALFAHSTGCID
jgi:hypothetical protein